MKTNQVLHCIFCGSETGEQHATKIGFVHIHTECLLDLEEILSLSEEEQEENKC